MSVLLKFLPIFSVVLLIGAISSPAYAACQKNAKISLSDGSMGCILKAETTEITSTQSVRGGGPATKRESKAMGGAVVLQFLSESDTRATSRNALNARAKEVCKRYRGEFIAKVTKPSNPFIVTIFVWGKSPQKALKGLSTTYREIYLTKNCWVKVHR